MAGVLEGLVVAEKAAMHEVKPALEIMELPEPGLRLVPLTAGLKASLRAGLASDPRVEGFYELTESVAGLAARLSGTGRVLYVHSEFHGGQGLQAVLGWEMGAEAFGPLFTATAHDPAEDWYETATPEEMAINKGLRWLGVRARPPATDEFSALGLDRHRWTDDFLT